MAAGPVIGGLLISTLGWRSIFEVNVVIGALCLAVTLMSVRPGPRVPRRMDPLGQLTAGASVGGVTFALIEGQRAGWATPPVVCAMAVAAIGAAAFFVTEARVGEPMFPPALARRSAFVGATAVGFGLNLALYGQVFVLSLFFQQILAQSALRAGLSFLPMTALIMVANLVGPRVAVKIGATRTVSGGSNPCPPR